MFPTQVARRVSNNISRVLVSALLQHERKGNYVGENPDVSYYGADAMSAKERADFLAWYEGQRSEVFDNRSILEDYFQDDVTVLRQACIVSRREFIEIGNVDVFTESVTIASASNKLLRKRFLKQTQSD